MNYVVTGANGKTGSIVAQRLLDLGCDVRVIVRREEQTGDWLARGATVLVANLSDAAAMHEAFEGASGAYLMNPPAYTARDIFATARNVHTILLGEAQRAGVEHVVALSSIGAQHASGTGNILTTHDLEQQLSSSKLRATVLRAANFIDNWSWSITPARDQGELPSMLIPVDRPLPMVAATDIGRVAADLLVQGSEAPALVELHGPHDYSPNDAAAALSTLLGRAVRAAAVPEHEWPGVFRNSGFSQSAVEAFCEMYRGFNSGHVRFSDIGYTLAGNVSLQAGLAMALQR